MENGPNTNKDKCSCKNCECFIIIEKEYWNSSVRVLTGLSWFILGITVSVIFSLFF
jgi:hypothetical protein